MIKQLSIQNYVLIDDLKIDFHHAFTAITGETGAGKSILLGALNLLLGKRADLSALLNKERKCILEIRIEVNDDLEGVFDHYELDFDRESILRREISPSGKSRSFINDTPVTLDVMKDMGQRLIDIHSQHQSIQIQNPQFRLDLIDRYSSNDRIRKDYLMRYETYLSNQKLLQDLIEKKESFQKKKDFLEFQFDELDALQLQEDEKEKLEEENNLFQNNELIKSKLSQINTQLSSGDNTLIDQIGRLKESFSDLKSYLTEVSELSDRLNSSYLELQDIANEIEMANESFSFDQERLSYVEERLSEIYRLCHKHNIDTTSELIELRAKLEMELQNSLNSDFDIKTLENELSMQVEGLEEIAKELSNTRVKVLKELEDEIQNCLGRSGIPNANFQIRHQYAETFTSNGKDEFEFWFSANKGVELQLLEKSASGGEMSRIMLAIKSALVDKHQLHSIIFDEIDTGISGAIAEQVGDIFTKMSKQRQLIAITHLPQIAAQADDHLLVFKQENEGITNTYIKQLDKEERVLELAKMISGKSVSEAAIGSAKELLSH